MSWDSYLERVENEVDCTHEVSELSKEFAIERKGHLAKPSQAPILHVLKHGESAAKIYVFRWEAAGMDNCRKTYNSNNWTVRGIAGELGMCHKTIAKAINKLMDDGVLQVIGDQYNSNGSNNSVWAITHPDWIENVQHAISLMGDNPSVRLQKMRAKAKRIDINHLPTDWRNDSWLTYDQSKQIYKQPAKPYPEEQK